MLRKKEAYTVITPIPSFIPRQLALDILHAHSEVITLNPLVLSHKPIPAPRTAASDEYYSTWYEITERIQFVPGVGRLGSSKISFNGCFHDMPWGLQTHIYAPMNVDLRNRYRIGGNQPGEPPEAREIGLEAPADGLYLREDIEIRCNVTVMSFVKAELKAASKEMVSRIIKKAELLDAGVLQAMMLDGRLKTVNPNDRTQASAQAQSQSQMVPNGLQSPTLTASTASPRMSMHQAHASFGSSYGARPGTAGSHYSTANAASPHPYSTYPNQQQQAQQQFMLQQQQAYPYQQLTQGGGGGMAELPYKEPQQTFPMELPGDYLHPQQPPAIPPKSPMGQPMQQQQSQPVPQSARYPGEMRWSPQPQPSPNPSVDYRNSMSSLGSGAPSPGFAPQGYGQSYSTELPAHRETVEEHSGR